jgi:DNA-binding transcriptional regulator PaaX
MKKEYNLSMVAKKLKYKGMSVNFLGLPDFSSKNYKKEKKTNKRLYLLSFSSNFSKNMPKNLLLIYDIPEAMKKERDWFRRQLVNFGFVMIQKSVWVGPSPLPEDFLGYLKEIKIEDNFKTFKLAKGYGNKK